MKICTATNCERKVLARGYCGTHYARWRNHGTVEKDPPNPIPDSIKPIGGYAGYYCSADGVIFSAVRKGRHLDRIGPLREMATRKRPDGYIQAHFRGKSPREAPLVHQIILSVWGSAKPSPDLVVNHKNGNKADNRLANLEWVTQRENIHHNLRMRGKK